MLRTLIQPTGKVCLRRLIQLIVLSALCVGCQSHDRFYPFDPFKMAPQVSIGRSPRLAAASSRTVSAVATPLPTYDGNDIWMRLGHEFNLVDSENINERIVRQREWLLEHPGFLREASQRARPYLHFITERLTELQMPLELALLPMIESAYNPKATSSRNAAGIWQFMPATGRDFNLRQTASYDGRRDLLASSKAAMDYLTRLRRQFGDDWLLAMAAYNAGEGTVARAIETNRQYGLPTDYWHLNLPRETQDYVPRLLALSQLVRDPQQYGVHLSPVANTPYLAVVALGRSIDLAQLSAHAGIDKDILLNLNPAFLLKITQDGPARLLVPRSEARQVAASLSAMERDVLASSDVKLEIDAFLRTP